MKKVDSNLEYIKKIDLYLLTEFKKICERNNLKYYLAFGTLLGAVRHKGFIPWDDDIDIWMPREDYNKFIEITWNKNNEKYEILHYSKNNKYLFPWIKMCDKNSIIKPSRFSSGLTYGVSIDIFPLDDLNGKTQEESLEYVNKFNSKYKKIYVKKYCTYNGYSINKKIIKFFVKKIWFYLSKILFKKSSLVLDELENELMENNGKYVSYAYDLVSKSFALPKELFEGNKKMMFEGIEFSVPNDYDTVLKSIYGDYMKLPPKEQQVTHHTYTCVIKEGE